MPHRRGTAWRGPGSWCTRHPRPTPLDMTNDWVPCARCKINSVPKWRFKSGKRWCLRCSFNKEDEQGWKQHGMVWPWSLRPPTTEQIVWLRELQNDRCGICGKDLSTLSHGSWVLDHDHATGYVRGLLCQPCNSSEGKREYRDVPEFENYRRAPPSMMGKSGFQILLVPYTQTRSTLDRQKKASERVITSSHG